MRKLTLTILFVVAALLLSAPCYAVDHTGDLLTLVDQWGDPAVWVDSGANLYVGGAASYGMGVYGDTALFVTHTETSGLVTHMDTWVFLQRGIDTITFVTHGETGLYVKHSDTGVFLIIGADTALFMTYAAYFVETSREGQAGGIATLDSSSRVPLSQLPAALAGALTYQGTHDASSNTFPIAEPDTGAYWVISDSGSLVFKDSFDSVLPGDFIIYNGWEDTWGWIQQQAPVSSVNTLTGDVTLTTNEISEGANNWYWTEARFYAHTTTDTPNYLRSDSSGYVPTASASDTYLTRGTDTGLIITSMADTILLRGSDTWTIFDTSAFVPTASAADTYLRRGIDTAVLVGSLDDTFLTRGSDTAGLITSLAETYLVRGSDTFSLTDSFLVRGQDTGAFFTSSNLNETYLVRGTDTPALITSLSETYLVRGSDTILFITSANLSETFLVRGSDTFSLTDSFLVRGFDTGAFITSSNLSETYLTRGSDTAGLITSLAETYLLRGSDTATFLQRGADTNSFLTRGPEDSTILNGKYVSWSHEDTGALVPYLGENVLWAYHFEAFDARSMSSIWVPDAGDYDAATGFYPAGGIGDIGYFVDGFGGMTMTSTGTTSSGNRLIYHPPHPVNLSGCDSMVVYFRSSLGAGQHLININFVDDVGGTISFAIVSQPNGIPDAGASAQYFDTIATVSDTGKSSIREINIELITAGSLHYMWIDGLTAFKNTAFPYQITRSDTYDFLTRADTSAGVNLDARYLFDTGTLVPYAGVDTAALVYTDTVTIADTGTMFVLNAGSAIGASLPAATGTARKITIKSIGGGAVTIWPVAGEAIDWEDSHVINQWGYVGLVDYATDSWAIITGG